MDRFIEDFAMRLPGADVVAISGNLPRGVPDDFTRRSCVCAITQARPRCWMRAVPPLRAALPATPDFIKPNASEMAALLGEPRTREEQIGDPRRTSGGVLPALSLGAEGCWLPARKAFFTVSRPPYSQATPSARELAITEQIRLAVAVATASALYIGTGDYAQGDFDAILPKVQVHRLQ